MIDEEVALTVRPLVLFILFESFFFLFVLVFDRTWKRYMCSIFVHKLAWLWLLDKVISKRFKHMETQHRLVRQLKHNWILLARCNGLVCTRCAKVERESQARNAREPNRPMNGRASKRAARDPCVCVRESSLDERAAESGRRLCGAASIAFAGTLLYHTCNTSTLLHCCTWQLEKERERERRERVQQDDTAESLFYASRKMYTKNHNLRCGVKAGSRCYFVSLLLFWSA